MTREYRQNATAIATPDSVTIYRDGESFTVTRQYADFNGIKEALDAGDFDYAIELADRAESLRRQSAGAFIVQNSDILADGVKVHDVISQRIIEFQERGLPFKPLVEFRTNLLANPNPQSIEEAYSFLEHKNLPVTSDGCFLAYKSVRNDYRSKYCGNNDVEVSRDGGKTWQTYRGHIPNDVGNIVRMKRTDVDDNCNRECSNGLHAGCLEYSGPAGWYHSTGDNIVIVKINPRDVVAVPRDESRTKMRVCEYEVIADYGQPLSAPLVKARTGIIETVKGWLKDVIGSITGTPAPTSGTQVAFNAGEAAQKVGKGGFTPRVALTTVAPAVLASDDAEWDDSEEDSDGFEPEYCDECGEEGCEGECFVCEDDNCDGNCSDPNCLGQF